ncbi:BspA family leucine-rich repeat surface protein [Mycoplasma cottewii]|uniref:BspA family leucine-rich repeat surface protein n=1 Tax=Mycoplasma cottewii TaxID=51364 RepID=A0ABY5TVL3_9MOLU|nr:BspA family leucine-rich repeat surface protein [Mycoplasma cottewii]UWD34687.1 BspA family leucine-rich repeat surface protein [Mycoplasma cottewii]
MARKGKLLSIIAGLLVSSSSVAGVTVGVLHNKRKLDAKNLNLTNDIPESVRSLKILYTENQQLILDQINVQRKILRTEKSHIEIELKNVEFKFNPSVPSVTISAKKSSKFLKGSVEIKFNKPNISSLIKEENKNLGVFEVRTIEKVIERLVERNLLNNKDFNAEKIKQNFDIQINEQEKTIKVKAKSDSIFYVGEVVFRYNLPQFSTLLKSTEDHKSIQSHISGLVDDQPDTILDRFFEINKEILEQDTVKITREQLKFELVENEAKITVENNINYEGSINVSYSIKTDIASLGLNTNAGAFNSNEQNKIIEKFIKDNEQKLPGFTVESFNVLSNQNGKLKIQVKSDNAQYQGTVEINYSIKTDIASLGLNTNAGAFNSNEQNKIIEKFIKDNEQKLPGFTVASFNVLSNQNGKLKIQVKSDNAQYQGTVEINYSIKTDIASLGLNTNAGAFNSNEQNKIIEKFIKDNEQKLPGFTVASFNVLSNQNGKLKIQVKSDNAQYQGTVEINYSIKTDIASLGLNTNAGAFNSNEQNKIIEKFIKDNEQKLPGFTVASFNVLSNQNGKLKIQVKSDNAQYQGTVEINYSIKTDIASLGLNTNAGAFNSNEQNKIIEKFIKDNEQKLPGFTVASFNVLSNQNGKLKIQVKSDNAQYQGTVEINYSIKTDIASLGLNTNAGAFNSNEQNKIIEKFIKDNEQKLPGFTVASFNVLSNQNGKLKIQVKSDNAQYQGTVEINYSIKTDIASLGLNTNAGAFNSNEQNKIIEKFIKDNEQKLPGFTVASFNVLSNQNGKLKIQVKSDNAQYQGTVEINYSIKTDIASLGLNTNAGAFNSNEQNKIIEKFIKDNEQKLPGFTVASFNVLSNQNGKLKIQVKSDNAQYQGTVEINYSIKTDIASLGLNTNAGAFNSNEQNKIIEKFIKDNEQKLPGFTVASFNVLSNQNGKLKIQVKSDNAQYQGTVEINYSIKTDIASLGLNTNAGAFNSNEQNKIIEKFIKDNEQKLPGFTVASFNVLSNQNGKLKIQVKSDNAQYQGTVEINYSIKTDIASLGLNTNAGAFNSNEQNKIIEKFIKDNEQKLPGFTVASFNVLSNQNGKLKIQVKSDNAQYQGTVEINYSIKTDIASLGLNTNAGAFNSNEQNKIIEKFIKDNEQKLPGFTVASFNVLSNQNGKLKIQVKSDNAQYQGTVEINYSIKEQFNTIQGIAKDINNLKNNNTQSVLNSFIELNTDLLNLNKITRQQLRVQVNDKVATITVNGNDKYQGSIQVNLSLSKQTHDYLNVLSDVKHDTILRRINELNNWNLSLNDLNIEINGKDIRITGKENKTKGLIGTINFEFGVKATYKDKNKELTRIGFFKNSFGEWQIEAVNADTNKVVPILPTFINSLESAFTRNRNTTISGLESWDTSNVTNMKSMFQHATKFNQALGDKFNTSKVTNMSFMFNRAYSFNSSLGINFDTSKVTNMEAMFKEAKRFDQVLGEKFNTSKVTNMKEMFYQAHKFNKSLGNLFDTSLVTTMESMFGEAKVFNGSLGDKFNTSKVANMSWMFWRAEKFNQSLGNSFDTSKATTMEGMFQEARAFNQVLGDKFNTSKVTNMRRMFYYANSFNKSLGDNFDTSQVTNMESMFGEARAFNQVLGDKFNTSKVTDMSWMFWRAEKFNSSLGNDFDTSQVTTMLGMFNEAKVFDQALGDKFNTSKVTNMEKMFYQAHKFNKSLGNLFDTSQVTNMKLMFGEAKAFNASLGNIFDTSKVTDMSWMFWKAEKFNSSLGNDFDTSQVTTMEGMFSGASSFNQSLGDKFNTSQVTNMKEMFFSANVFNKSLGNSFDTSKVTTMEYMFSKARAFNQVLGDNFNTSKVENMKDMFSGASSFNQSLGNKFNTTNVRNMQSMFSGASSFNQSLGNNFDTTNVNNMRGMFHQARNFNQSLGDKFNTSNVTDMTSMFHQAVRFNGSLGNNFNTSQVTSMVSMFDSAYAFNQSLGDKFDTSKVTSMEQIFYDARNFNQSLGNNFDTSQVTNMRLMFYNTPFNHSLGDKFDTSKVTDMRRMFLNAKAFNQSLGDKFDTSKVTRMERMFANASSFNQDISHFNTSQVTTMEQMFAGASSFNQNINTKEIEKADGSKYTAWDVSKVTDMTKMFENARAFDQDISKWNVTISDTKKFENFNNGANPAFKDQKLPEKIRNSLRTNS